MSGPRLLMVGGLVLAAVLGRQFLPSATESDEPLPPIPVTRFVDDVPLDGGWTPNPNGRDPFVPLILPDPPPLPDFE